MDFFLEGGNGCVMEKETRGVCHTDLRSGREERRSGKQITWLLW